MAKKSILVNFVVIINGLLESEIQQLLNVCFSTLLNFEGFYIPLQCLSAKTTVAVPIQAPSACWHCVAPVGVLFFDMLSLLIETNDATSLTMYAMHI